MNIQLRNEIFWFCVNMDVSHHNNNNPKLQVIRYKWRKEEVLNGTYRKKQQYLQKKVNRYSVMY